jgi:hypothetical protein
MKRPDDQFTHTEFYKERESAILRYLKPGPLPNGSFPGRREGRINDISDVIYYTGCVAGSLALPLDSDIVAAQLCLLRDHSRDGQWPEIARLLSEIYARANEETIAQIKADPDLSQQPWALVRIGRVPPPASDFENQPDRTGDDGDGPFPPGPR